MKKSNEVDEWIETVIKDPRDEEAKRAFQNLLKWNTYTKKLTLRVFEDLLEARKLQGRATSKKRPESGHTR